MKERYFRLDCAVKACAHCPPPGKGRTWHRAGIVRESWILAVGLLMVVVSGACHQAKHDPFPQRPDVAPAGAHESGMSLPLDRSRVEPMYTELIPIDLSSVVRVALAENHDIKHARARIEASRGEMESAVGRAFPAIVPTALFEHVEGTVRATEGNLVGVGFDTFQPSIAIQWIVNPGRVVYDIVAARERLRSSEHRESAVVQQVLREAMVQYYDLALSQARVATAHQGVLEADELLRINKLRVDTGTGVRADALRAEARLAERRQELIIALNRLYEASIKLSLTLRLDPTVTLVPDALEIRPTRLVRMDIAIEELLGYATTFRPDLEAFRRLVEAAEADSGSTWWRGFGPDLSLGYQYGGITGHADHVKGGEGVPSNLIVNPASADGSFSSNPVANGLAKEGLLRGSRRLDGREDQTFGFSDQQRTTAAARWRISLAIFGDLKKARAVEKQAVIEAERALERARAEVVAAAQAGAMQAKLMQESRRQVEAAEEALRLSQANLDAGTMTTLDVLQSQDAATKARLHYAESVIGFNQAQVELLTALGLMEGEAVLADS